MNATFGCAVWTIFRKDLAVWWRNRRNVAASVIPILSLLLLGAREQLP